MKKLRAKNFLSLFLIKKQMNMPAAQGFMILIFLIKHCSLVIPGMGKNFTEQV